MPRTVFSWNALTKRVSGIPLLALLYVAVVCAQGVDRTPAALLSEAEKELHLGNTTNAKELFTSALRMDPNSVPARIGIGKVAIKERQVDRRVKELIWTTPHGPIRKQGFSVEFDR